MKLLLICSAGILGFAACDGKNERPAESVKDAASKRLEAAKKFDREHDQAMKEATKFKVPEPKPAGPIR